MMNAEPQIPFSETYIISHILYPVQSQASYTYQSV